MIFAGEVFPSGTSDSKDTACPPLSSDPASTECSLRLKRQRHDDLGSAAPSTQQLREPALVPSTASAGNSPAATVQPAVNVAPAVPWHASLLYNYVRSCLDALTAMHSCCAFISADTKAAELACAIFRRAVPHIMAVLPGETYVAQAVLAASLWVAIKFEATRPTTPDSSIMSHITGIPGGFLRQLELQILEALQWDLMGPAREVSAVDAVNVASTPAYDQPTPAAVLSCAPTQAYQAPAAQAAAVPTTAVHVPHQLDALRTHVHAAGGAATMALPPALLERLAAAEVQDS